MNHAKKNMNHAKVCTNVAPGMRHENLKKWILSFTNLICLYYDEKNTKVMFLIVLMFIISFNVFKIVHVAGGNFRFHSTSDANVEKNGFWFADDNLKQVCIWHTEQSKALNALCVLGLPQQANKRRKYAPTLSWLL